MMDFVKLVEVCLIGIGSNLDNCGVGLVYGSQHIRISHRIYAIINLIGFVTAFIGASFGVFVSAYVSEQTAIYLSVGVLLMLGLSAIHHGYVKSFKQQSSTVAPSVLTWKQGVLLGFGLSATNIVCGFGATLGEEGLSTVWLTTLTITVWGYLCIWLGNVVGVSVLAHLLGNYASLASGLLLISLAGFKVLSPT